MKDFSTKAVIGLLSLFSIATVTCAVLISFYLIPTQQRAGVRTSEVVQTTNQMCSAVRSVLDSNERLYTAQVALFESLRGTPQSEIFTGTLVATESARLANRQNKEKLVGLC